MKYLAYGSSLLMLLRAVLYLLLDRGYLTTDGRKFKGFSYKTKWNGNKESKIVLEALSITYY